MAFAVIAALLTQQNTAACTTDSFAPLSCAKNVCWSLPNAQEDFAVTAARHTAQSIAASTTACGAKPAVDHEVSVAVAFVVIAALLTQQSIAACM